MLSNHYGRFYQKSNSSASPLKLSLNNPQISTPQASQINGIERIDAILNRLYPSKNEGDPSQGKLALASLVSTDVEEDVEEVEA